MKNIILLAVIIAFTLVSCNQKNKDSETTNAPVTKQDTTTTVKDGTEVVKDSTSIDKVYACPMHPEAKGKLNDKCPKCGMKLNVEVK